MGDDERIRKILSEAETQRRLTEELDEQARRQRHAIHRARKRQQMTSLLTIYALFVAIAAFTLAQGGLFNGDDNSGDNIEKIAQLERESAELKHDIDSLSKSIANSNNPDVSLLLQRVDKVEQKQNNIEQTILQDPDKAITATLLREKQINLEKNLASLDTSVNRIDSRVDLILISVIVVPIVGILLSKLINKIWPDNKPKLQADEPTA